nr:TPA: cytochrome c oxidase subunit II [Bdellodrilus illuminatus]
MYIPFWNGFLFQDPSSKIMNILSDMHDYYMILLTLITILVFSLLIIIMTNKKSDRTFFSHENMENLWIIGPFSILCLVIYPSVNMMFSNEDFLNPDVSVKVVGHQWYWSYEYSNFNLEPYDSYMINENDLTNSDFRLLEVDNRLILPYGLTSQLLISASDVLHSWAIPSLGLKLDAAPGRLNQTCFKPLIYGLLYGQCSEICGVNHSFMPISIEIIKPSSFLMWIKTM